MAILDPVQGWLTDLRLSTETECMSVLQGKSLSKDLQQSSTTLIKSGVDAIRNQSHVISKEFSKLFKCVEGEKWKHVQPLTVQVTCHIRSLIQECNRCIHSLPVFIMEILDDFLSGTPYDLKDLKQQEVVMGECAKLAQQVESSVQSSKTAVTVKIPLVNQLTFLGQSFSRLVDMALGYLIQKIVETLDESHTPLALTSCISTVISLGLEGEHMCYILSREGCIRALFEICRTDTLEFAHVQALRSLATICCVPESILELEKEGGVDGLTDILCDKTVSEAVRGEAAGVIAQITSPCLDNFQHIAGFLENLEDLLGALIGLCYNTSSHETFLLASAAVANITFMDSQACDVLQTFEAPKLLLHVADMKKGQSLFVKDQIATVLANMATMESSRQDIIAYNGVPVLIGYLQHRPAHCKTEAETSACERVQQKAAIALTRLCKDVDTAQVIVDLQGISRLVQLCRNITERNNSDAVLVASLAALRKICSLCPSPDMTTVDYHQLIKPRLMDSFLMCSHSDENFV